MADVYKGLTIEIDANTTKLSKKLNDAKRLAKGTTSELNTLQRALKLDPGNTKMLTQQMDAYQRKLKSAQEELKALKEAEKQIGKEGMSSEQWTRLQSDIAKSEAYIKKYQDAIKDLEWQTSEAGRKSQEMADKFKASGEKIEKAGDKIQAASGKLQNAGGSLTSKVTMPLAAAGTAAIVAATQIDDGLTSVRKTVDGTEEEYEQLKQAAVEYSKTNPVSAAQMLELDALGAQLGFNIDELELFGKVASGLDISTDMDAETASTEMAQFANITRMAHEDIGRYGSTIVNLGNHLATTESKISSMAQRVGAAGTQVKMSQSQILAWSGAMSSLGIEAEAGGTAFSTTIANIDKAVATGSKSLEKYAQLAGVSANEFKTAWGQDASAAFQNVLKGLAASENMSVVLEDLGINGIRQVDVLKRLAGNTELVGQAIDYANQGWENDIFLQKEVENRNESLNSKFATLKNKVTAVAAEVGKPLANALLDCVDAAEPLIKLVEEGADAFAKMSKEEQRSILKNIALVASLGPMLSIVGKLGSVFGGTISGIGAATKAYGEFSTKLSKGLDGLSKTGGVIGKVAGMMSPLKLGLVGVAGAAVAVVAAFAIHKWNEWREAQEKNEKASRKLKDITDELEASTGNTTGKVQNLGKALQDSAKKADGIRDSLAGISDNFSADWSDALARGGELEYYIEQIDKLRDQQSLTRGEQEMLTQAVEKYNEISGGYLEILDLENGKLSESTEQLRANAEAWKYNAKIKAYQSVLEESSKQMVEAEMLEADLRKQKNQAQDEYNKLLAVTSDEIMSQYGSYDAYNAVLYGAKRRLDDANDALAQNQKNLTDASRKMHEAEDAITALSDTKAKVESFIKTISSLGKNATRSLAKAGIDINEYAQAIAYAGIETGDFEMLTDTAFSKMVEECGTNTEKMKAYVADYTTSLDDSTWMARVFSKETIDAFNNTGVPIAEFRNRLRAAGISTTDLKNISKQQWDEIFANANGDINKIIEAIRNYNSNEHFEEKVAKVSSQGGDDLARVRDDWNNLVNSPNTVTKKLIAELEGKSLGVAQAGKARPLWGKNASGGIAIPKHADGGIATHATLTRHGWVGEDGWEAIIPLSNGRYVRPFAQAVAQQMQTVNSSNSETVQIILDGAVLNSDEHMQETALDLLEQIQRKAGMNRG